MNLSYFQFLRALLPYAAYVPTLLSLAEQLMAAKTLQAKWEVIKQLGDQLVPIIENADLSSVSAMSDEALPLAISDLELELSNSINNCVASAQGCDVVAQAFDGSRLKKLFEVIGPLLPILVTLLK